MKALYAAIHHMRPEDAAVGISLTIGFALILIFSCWPDGILYIIS